MEKKYNIIYADIPWSFNDKHSGGSFKSGAIDHYDVMSLDQIKKLDIKSIAADDCYLFLWWVNSQPKEALEVIEAWGFKLKTMCGFTWYKRTKNDKPWFGMGHTTRQATENMAIAAFGKPKRASASVRQVVEVELDEFHETIEAINEKHSKKPLIFADRIVELCGDLPRVELFARDKKQGWDSWGNEIESDLKINMIK